MAAAYTSVTGINGMSIANTYEPILASPLSSCVTRRVGYVIVLPSNTLLPRQLMAIGTTMSGSEIHSSLRIHSPLFLEPSVL